jgi:hypothetical protein
MMVRYECPICHAEYETNPRTCQCGFEGIEYPAYETQSLMEEYEKKRLFKIYKFAKRVVTGEIPYEPSPLTVYEYDDQIYVEESVDDRGLAYVDVRGDKNRRSFAAEGLAVFRARTPALYLNTDEAHANFLDESHVRMLFFGPDFRGFPNGYFIPQTPLRYIWVNEKNPYLSAENNVLFDKNKKKLICYAHMRPETEYRVPASVKTLMPLSFFHPEHLKKLWLPKGITVKSRALVFDEMPEIIYY